MIWLKTDSRDRHYHIFGQTTDFPLEISFDSQLPDAVQPIGDVKCTCYTTCDIANDQDKVIYDIQDLWSRIPQTAFGADPRDALKEAVKRGLLPLNSTLRLTHWSSYWRADTGGMDAFDNVRSALLLAQSPVGCATMWCTNWHGGILTTGTQIVGGHMYAIEGWKQINGEPHFIIEAWTGEKMFMPRDVFNKAVSALGCGAWVLSTKVIDDKRKKELYEKIADLLINVRLLVEQIARQIFSKKVDNPIVPPPPSDIIKPMETKSERLYNLSKSLIGKYLTLDTTVPKSLNCAESMSYVLKEFGYPIPTRGIAGTASLFEWLRKNLTQVTEGQKGDIIINITGTGNIGTRGHVGVIGEKAIMSNDSETGTWQPYWSLPAWLQHYEIEGGMKTHYFRV